MLTKNAIKLLSGYGKVQALGGGKSNTEATQFEILIDGEVRVGFVPWNSKVGRAYAMRGFGQGREDLYFGYSLRDALRAALRRGKSALLNICGIKCPLTVEVSLSGDVSLTPQASFRLGAGTIGVILDRRDEDALAMAEAFVSDAMPTTILLDWLQEQHTGFEQYVQDVGRLAGKLALVSAKPQGDRDENPPGCRIGH